ncbi:MAG: hypothetical protein IJB83_00795 [Bacilli bacterium]|nr:hypothetical protein [Bacilli bacterium]
MKRILFMFCIVLLLCGCKSNDLNNDDNVNESNNQTNSGGVRPAEKIDFEIK